jgi:hypothetical protein
MFANKGGRLCIGQECIEQLKFVLKFNVESRKEGGVFMDSI